MPQLGWHIAVELSVRLSENFYVGHNLCNIEDSNLIFGMHVDLMKLHVLSGESSRSRSSFKVEGKKNKMKGSNKL